jgi:hypothetical protein
MDNVAAGINVARTNLLEAGEAKSEDPYLENVNLSTPPLISGKRSRYRTKGRRSLIVDNAISIDAGAKT